MEFIVYIADGEDHYNGESRYNVGNGNGVLTVFTEDGKHIFYGPAAWLRLEETEPAGGPPGGRVVA